MGFTTWKTASCEVPSSTLPYWARMALRSNGFCGSQPISGPSRRKRGSPSENFLLDQLNRNAAFTQEEIQRLDLAVPQTLPALKRQWCAALERAGRLLTALPVGEVGCLYLDSQQSVPVQPDPTHEAFASLQRHFGSVRGAWPKIC